MSMESIAAAVSVVILYVTMAILAVVVEERFGIWTLWRFWVLGALIAVGFYAWVTQPENSSLALRTGLPIMRWLWVPVAPVLTALTVLALRRRTMHRSTRCALAAIVFLGTAFAGTYPLIVDRAH
jgi:hypothetical protein